MNRSELAVRISAIGLAAATPLACIAVAGLHSSYSYYWITPMQPLFILANVITAYYFFQSDKWKAPSTLLILLTAFSVADYPLMHNIFAVAFFLSCCEPLFNCNHFRWLFIPYVVSVLACGYQMMIGETIAILILSIYHGLMLHKQVKLLKTNK